MEEGLPLRPRMGLDLFSLSSSVKSVGFDCTLGSLQPSVTFSPVEYMKSSTLQVFCLQDSLADNMSDVK